MLIHAIAASRVVAARGRTQLHRSWISSTHMDQLRAVELEWYAHAASSIEGADVRCAFACGGTMTIAALVSS
jgi:hypothetical protein